NHGFQPSRSRAAKCRWCVQRDQLITRREGKHWMLASRTSTWPARRALHTDTTAYIQHLAERTALAVAYAINNVGTWLGCPFGGGQCLPDGRPNKRNAGSLC